MQSRSVLMVEGKDDEHVVKHICGMRNIGKIDHIHDYGGKERLLEGIGPRLKESDLMVLGMILDANGNVASTWAAVSSRLAEAGFDNLPSALPESGLILSPGGELTRVGVWLMPNNKDEGVLEDFLGFMVAEEDRLMPYVVECVERIPADLIRFSPVKRTKATMHAWLALQPNPGTPFGQAITAQYLNPKTIRIDAFVHWLKGLYFPEIV